MESAQRLNTLPDYLPVPGQDVFNYLAGAYASNHQLHMALTFDGHLSQNILAKAIRLTLDLEPVLGCRFVEQPKSAFWERRTDLDDLNLCPVCETEHTDEELREFIALAADSGKDPLVQVKIFRTQNRDILCVRLDHACGDGGGLKEYVYMLSEVYNHLCSHRPYPVSPILPRRDCGLFLKQFGIDDARQAWDPSQAGPPPTWAFPANNYRNQQPAFMTGQLNKKKFLALEGYAKNNTVTINDLLLTAYYRAFFKITRTPENQPRPVMVTVDLRRYMPEGTKITAANVSSSFNALLSNIAGESFSATLKRVAQMTAELKQNHAEIPIAVLFELFGLMDFADVKGWFKNARQQALETNLSTPLFSNIGVINPVTFGEHPAIEGYIVTPAMFAPGFMLGASTYNQVLSLVVNYYTSDIEKELVQAFLSGMVKDLENCTA